MSNENVVSRGIRSVRDVVFQENSPTHKVGLVIEPGNWEEADPFLLMAEDFLYVAHSVCTHIVAWRR